MTTHKRPDNRKASDLRPLTLTPGFVGTADGSCLIELGGTRVICTASFSPGVPKWRAGKGLGWVTAEYGMLPASTGRRKSRPITKPDSRATEIQRLIGRVLRSIVDDKKLGENTIAIDCDVLEADGGTRTASITGAYVALAIAIEAAAAKGLCHPKTLRSAVAAISVGVVQGQALLDLNYIEDSTADVDMNIAMTRSGKFVEIQGTSEAAPFDGKALEQMLALARRGIRKLLAAQSVAITQGRKKRK